MQPNGSKKLFSLLEIKLKSSSSAMFRSIELLLFLAQLAYSLYISGTFPCTWDTIYNTNSNIYFACSGIPQNETAKIYIYTISYTTLYNVTLSPAKYKCTDVSMCTYERRTVIPAFGGSFGINLFFKNPSVTVEVVIRIVKNNYVSSLVDTNNLYYRVDSDFQEVISLGQTYRVNYVFHNIPSDLSMFYVKAVMKVTSGAKFSLVITPKVEWCLMNYPDCTSENPCSIYNHTGLCFHTPPYSTTVSFMLKNEDYNSGGILMDIDFAFDDHEPNSAQHTKAVHTMLLLMMAVLAFIV
jgi:hypothetical protein